MSKATVSFTIVSEGHNKKLGRTAEIIVKETGLTHPYTKHVARGSGDWWLTREGEKFYDSEQGA